LITCHSFGKLRTGLRSEAEPVLSEAGGKNLVLGKRAFFYANNEIPFDHAQDRLRLRGVYPERSEGLRLRMTDISFYWGGVLC
jgi:hypothetical protein